MWLSFWKTKYLASLEAKLTVLILAFLCKGCLSQNLDYTLTMPASVSVLQGLGVYIPCQFTFPPQTSSEKLYGYWFKKLSGSHPHPSDPGHLVATNDKKAAVHGSAVNRVHFVGNPDQGNCSFSIHDSRWGDNGQYYFRIEQGGLKYSYINHSDRIYTSPSVFVLEPPQDIEILADITSHGGTALCAPERKGDSVSAVAQEGESISLVCKAQGRPDPTLSWKKGNRTLNGSKEGEEHTLLLSEVRPEDAGEYQCHAENVHGSTRKTLLICVEYGPRLNRTQRKPTCWHDHGNLLCACSMHSWPPPRIQWQVDGETINKSIPGEAVQVTFQAQGNELTSSLNWTRSPNEDYRITCSATNPSGAYTIQFVLRSSITKAHPSLLISALSGPLVTATIFLLGMCLIRLLKQRKVSSHSKGQQAADETSVVYDNIMPMEGIAHGRELQDPVGRHSGIYCNLLVQDITYSHVLPEQK